MTFFDFTADLVGQLNWNGQKGMLQIEAPPVENFYSYATAIRHLSPITCTAHLANSRYLLWYHGHKISP